MNHVYYLKSYAEPEFVEFGDKVAKAIVLFVVIVLSAAMVV